jgi:uracil phosphoribosyltransferase
VIAGRKVAVVPVLRAGLGMAEGLMQLIPSARQGHVGLYRGADRAPVEYYVRLPDVEGRIFIVCDPMLATGQSAAHAVQALLDRGVAARNVRFLALVAAPEGVAAFSARHPEVPVYVAALDSHLDENAYIVPGLGDAGDRVFGTKH